MYYLGITSSGNNPGAAIIKDNQILACAEEERFIRIKHAEGRPAINAIKFCLEKAGVSLSEVKVGIAMHPKLFTNSKFLTLNLFNPTEITTNIREKQRTKTQPKILEHEFGTKFDYEFVQHHIGHQYSSFPVSGFDKGVSISVDGRGEEDSMMIARFDKDGITEIIKDFKLPNSLGIFYSKITDWLGFRFGSGEGKTMGLAPYGKPVLDFSDLISYGNGKFKTIPMNSNLIEKKFGPRRKSDEPLTELHKNVAATTQDQLEKCLLHMVDYYAKGENLCLSGGVALNCVANGIITKSGLVKDIFIQPISNDTGSALGSAIMMAMKDGHRFEKMKHPYLGPEYTNQEINKSLKSCNLKSKFIKNIEKETAKLIAKGNVIGWMQGAMECGPRALGNRSILGDPRNPKMKDILNDRVKHREGWRPFCPSILDEYRTEYLDTDYESPFMIQAFGVKKEKQKKMISAVHVDGTARPQTVTKEQNPRYYKLIDEFRKLTGVPVLINTSFNIKGEPVVCTPEDAIRCYFGTGMDYLVIGNYLISK